MSRALAVVLFAAFAACSGSSADVRTHARVPAPPVTTSPLLASLPAPALPPSPPLSPFDPTAITRALDDPRLDAARALVAAGKPVEAARTIAKVAASADAHDVAVFSHLEGRLRLAGGNPKGAAAAFDKAAGRDSALQPYALLAAAEALAGLGDFAGAVTRARAADGRAPAARLDPLYARSLVRSGKIDDGLARYRKAMGPSAKKNPKVALELARALLAHPGEGRALEALRIATEIDLDAPRSKLVEDAAKIADEARSNASSDDRKTVDDMPAEVKGARLAASGQGKRALAILDRLAKKGPLGCAGSSGRAEALAQVKRFSEASEEYGRASDACAADSLGGAADGLDARDGAALLFAGARAAQKGGDGELAKKRFEKLERDFKSSRFADDARLERGRISLEGGDLAAADKILGSIADDYPSGDVTKDALFSIAVAHASRGDWTGALSPLTRGSALEPDRGYERAGRFAYFRGRALVATGKRDEGRAELERAAREFPCGYYASLALARLDGLGPRARPADGSGRAASKSTPSFAWGAPAEVLASPTWAAAVDLVRADDPELALAALGQLGVADRTASPDTIGAAAALLALAADPAPAHLLLRSAFESEPRAGRSEFRAFRSVAPAGAALAAWRIAYPRPFAELAARASEESGVSEALLYAVMREESAFSPVALSKAGAVGLLQLMPATARKMAKGIGVKATDASLRDPATNLRLGAHYLAVMQKRFSDNPLLAIPAYNAGPGAPESWTSSDPSLDFDLFVEAIPYAETRAYTKRVIASLAAYETIYPESRASAGLTIPERARTAP